ncbi:ATP-binding protein [Xanthomonas theicola]|nr:transporter substrate-binding domain-containing protein [Xanthomonas theicola]QNH25522.1 transporter substrate-binding domain-containing protein [Xanthomonas theicola]
MTARLLWTLFVGWTVLCMAPSTARAQQPGTQAPLVVGFSRQGLAPLAHPSEHGATGYSIDYLRRLAQSAGWQLAYRSYPTFQDSLDALCRGEIDIVPDVIVNEQRSRCLIFTTRYLDSRPVLVTRNATAPITGDNWRTFRFVAERGQAVAQWLAQWPGPVPPLLVENTRAALAAVEEKRADAYLGEPYQLDGVFKRSGFSDLQVRPQSIYDDAGLHFALSWRAEALRARLDAAMAAMPPGELARLQAHWLDQRTVQSRTAADTITPGQRAMLQRQAPLRLGFVPSAQPIGFLDDDGAPQGIASGYLDYLTRQTGLQVEPVPVSGSAQARARAERGELDMLMPLEAMDERVPGWAYTKPFTTVTYVVVARADALTYSALEGLDHAALAVPDHPTLRRVLGRRLPHSRLAPAGNDRQGLQMVLDGHVQGYVGNLAVVDALIAREFSGRLKVVAPTDISMGLLIAVSPSHAELVPIIDNLIDAMPRQQRRRIDDHWLRNSYQFGVSQRRVFALVGGSILASVLVIALVLRLYLASRRRTRALQVAEQRLTGQLHFNSLLLDAYPLPVAVKDGQQRYVRVNRAYQDAFDVSEQGLVGQRMQDVSHYAPDLRQRVIAATGEALASGEPNRREYVVPDRHGRRRIWLNLIQPYRLDGATSAGVLSTFIDLTSIREAEQKARRLESMLSRITANLPATVFEIRADGDGAFCFSYVAGNVEELFGQSSERLAAEPQWPATCLSAADHRRARRRFALSAARMRPLSLEFQVAAHCGGKWLRTEAAPRREEDGTLAWSGVCSDITKAREYESELARTTALAEVAARSKANFLATMSHEIRTPMNGVLGLLEILSRSPLPEEAGAMLSTVMQSARSLQHILDDILDLSRLESDQVQIVTEPADLVAMLENVLSTIGHRAHDKGLRLRCHVDRRVGRRLQLDVIRLRQVLMNLISNAIKFTHHGQIRVALQVEEEQGPLQTIRFEVRDTGIGITPAQLEKLFEPFSQADDAIARQYGGSGLGLMICRRLVRLMGGDIAMHSVHGQGTAVSFAVRMPCVEASPPPSAGAPRVGLALGEPSRREDVRQQLLALGVEPVDGAASPAAPVALWLLDEAAAQVPGVPCAWVVDEPLTLGYAEPSGRLLLSVNPLSRKALQQVLGRLLPRAPSGPVAAPAPAPRSGFLEYGSVLVVEDHPTNQILLRQQLIELQCMHEIVGSGRDGMAALAAQSFALVLSDCYMAGMDGYRMTELIRAGEAAGQRLPIVGMTASTLPEEQERARAAGMDMLLLKPIGLEQLEAVLRRYLGPPEPLASAAQSVRDGVRAAMRQAFVDETAKDLGALDQAMAAGDRGGARDSLHKIGGGLAVLGERGLSAQARALLEALAADQPGIEPGLHAFERQLRQQFAL